MTRTGLHSHNVAFLQFQVVHIMVISLAGMLELYLHQIRRVLIARHVSQPVVGVELSILSAYSLMA